MNNFAYRIAIALFVGRLLCSLSTFVRLRWPWTENTTMVLWFDKDYTEAITIPWYIYELTNIFNKGVWIFCFAMAARLINEKLYMVLIIYFFAHCLTFIGYIYNRNSSYFSEIIMYIAIIFPMFGLFFPSKRKAKIISYDRSTH